MADTPSSWHTMRAVSALQEARDRLLNDPDLAADENSLIEVLGPVTDDVQEVLARILRAARRAKILAASAKAEADTISARAARYEKREQTMRQLGLSLMEVLNKKSVEIADLSATVTRGRQTVRFTNEADVPDAYAEIVTVRKLDRAMIAADLKAGRDVPGAELSNAADFLTIRVG